mmetsp:Transcript_89807/g.258885  ORF Transcript_89807/g.258885 Transcript_89807/m.258885 type:complete len:261 (-) Transcript_89807:618-1400(-)
MLRMLVSEKISPPRLNTKEIVASVSTPPAISSFSSENSTVRKRVGASSNDSLRNLSIKACASESSMLMGMCFIYTFSSAVGSCGKSDQAFFISTSLRAPPAPASDRRTGPGKPDANRRCRCRRSTARRHPAASALCRCPAARLGTDPRPPPPSIEATFPGAAAKGSSSSSSARRRPPVNRQSLRAGVSLATRGRCRQQADAFRPASPMKSSQGASTRPRAVRNWMPAISVCAAVSERAGRLLLTFAHVQRNGSKLPLIHS